MTTIQHQPAQPIHERRGLRMPVGREVWASLTISIMWLTVLLDALFGPDIETRGVAGDSAVIPSAVVLSFFVFLATWIVARHGFRGDASG
jgi:hypothetical protein